MSKWTARIVNRLKRRRKSGEPAVGRLIRPSPADAMRDYPSSGLTPQRLASIFNEADAGAPARAMQLFEEMEEKDAHLYAVASKRRLALTGLPWTVRSAAESNRNVDKVLADEAAHYCQAALSGMDSFDAALRHLSLAVGRNIAIAEMVWDRVGGELALVDIIPVDFTRIVFDDLDCPRVLTRDDSVKGMELIPNKFILHTPHGVSGHPSRGGLLRVTSLAFVGKNLAVKDWMIFAEVFGMPVRIARYDASATAEEKNEIMHMLTSLGSNAAGMFSRAIELQFIEAGQGKSPPPYENLASFLNREMSKAWLGQTLTTETPGLGGTFGATRIHEEVRKDLRADDIRNERRTIVRDLLGPLARLKFGPKVPVPIFIRKVEQPRSIQELTEVLDAAVNRLGVRVPEQWAHEALSIPVPAGHDAILPGIETEVAGQRATDRHVARKN